MEGVAAEAGSLAGHLGLGKLIYLYDANDITLDGPTTLAFSAEDVSRRYEAYGWQVLRVESGDTDLEGISQAIVEAKADRQRPSLIFVHTTIGFGSPNKAGSSSAHGSPLGAEEVAATKRALGCDPDKSFYVSESVLAHMAQSGARGGQRHAQWHERVHAYAEAYPELYAQWQMSIAGELPTGWASDLPSFAGDHKPLATRVAGGKALNALAGQVPWLFGGDADLGCSTKTVLADGGDFDGRTGAGRNIHFGVREHAMGAICNGMLYHGGIRPYCATFFCVLRLHASSHPVGGHEPLAGGVRVDPRLYRRGRRWADPSAGRAFDGPAKHSQSARCAAVRRQRSSPGLDLRVAAHSRPDRAGAVAPESADLAPTGRRFA